MFLPFSPGSVNFYLQAGANGFAERSTERAGPLPGLREMKWWVLGTFGGGGGELSPKMLPQNNTP